MSTDITNSYNVILMGYRITQHNNGNISAKQRLTKDIIIIWDSEEIKEECLEDHDPLSNLIN